MPKNIVLCSDGTGNSAAKRGSGTNVWKMYRSIEVNCTNPRQVAFYDDGVGSEGSRLLKAVGGAFGYGLTRNILDLYASLVHHYEPGDEIFLFGFSRGAFTVRSLAGLISRCGIVDRNKPSRLDLRDRIEEAVRIYGKAHRKNDPNLALDFRAEYGIVTGGGKGCEDPLDVPIKMIGVWDTVGAVGLPFAELTDAFDKIFHFKFHKCNLHRCVEFGYQALAIDDERHTFHPLVWDEVTDCHEKPHQTIEQVWFSGVHSNVGGGYPKDQMAYVSLAWMMDKAHACGLKLRQDLRKEFCDEANVHGKLYDSRSGLSAYYRYRPRRIQELVLDLEKCRSKLRDRVKIHASVFDRIRQSTESYAPFNLPNDFEVVGTARGALPQVGSRELARSSELAWDMAWWRRLLYFGFVFLSVLLVVQGWLWDKDVEAVPLELPAYERLFDAASWVAPPALEGWVMALEVRPFWVLFYLVAALLLIRWRKRLKRSMADVETLGWRYAFGRKPNVVQGEGSRLDPTWCHRLARKIRRSVLGMYGLPAFKRHVLPLVVLPATAVALGYGLWWLFSPAHTEASEPARQVLFDAPREAHFVTSEPCARTDVLLEAGVRYRIDVAVVEPWRDKTLEATPAGLEHAGDRALLRWADPFRRSESHGIFVLLGSVDCGKDGIFPIGAGTELVAPATGPLALFVNDVVCLICPGGPWWFYDNNSGSATVTVTRLPDRRDAEPLVRSKNGIPNRDDGDR